ncbi:MAG: hypothetical protein ACR2MT_03795 [Aurantibacter sp.]
MFGLLQRKDRSQVLIESLRRFVQKGNWSDASFGKLDGLLSEIGYLIQNGTISKSDVAEISTSFTREFLAETLQGHGLRKPYGYPGDFLLLDKIYTHYKTRNPKFRIWDDYFQAQAAPLAVRNRKEYFKDVVVAKGNENCDLRLLNVVSGPGRELYELYMNLPEERTMNTTCVEVDDYAIAYSKGLNTDYLSHINYVHSNIFKFQSDEKYDLIWSAGLFDYLNDKAFSLLLERFKKWLLPVGEIVIGNFNQENNPSPNYMEIMGDWHLIRRTEEQLKELAKQAGFLNHQIKVSREELSVNLFLHLKLN